MPSINEIVPVGDDVAERTALMAKGDATVHAAPGLRFEKIVGEMGMNFSPILDPFLNWTVGRDLSFGF